MTTSQPSSEDLILLVMQLSARVEALERGPAARRTEPPPVQGVTAGEGDDQISRRHLLRRAAAAAAVGAFGAAVAEPAGPAAALDGNAVTAGQSTTAEACTTLLYDASAAVSGVLLLSNDTSFVNDGATYPAALGGWAGDGTTGSKVPNGVFGYTENHDGHGVVGLNTSYGSGVFGRSSDGGSGVAGESATVGVQGYCTGLDHGIGVLGTAQGPHGVGIEGQTSSGIGVYGTSNSGTGLFGQSGTGHALSAGAAGSTPSAVISNTGSGIALFASAAAGRGGVFRGGAAQVQLIPGLLASHPAHGTRGDLYADSTGRLWFCKITSATAATWHQLA